MTIELLSIGDELLSGQTINTNAATLARALQKEGFTIDRTAVLPDEEKRLKAGIQEALDRASIVITTGGLGPTGDDLTRDVVAEIFDAPLIKDEAVAKDLIVRFGKDLPTLEDQARIPIDADVIPNPLGTAPGFIMQGKIIVLPGVPSQMEAMIPAVIDLLKKMTLKRRFVKPLYLSLLSEQAVDPFLRALEKKHPHTQIGICPGYGILSVYVQGEGEKELLSIREEIASQFKTHVYSKEEKEIAAALHAWMIAHKKTVALAESCTGGHFAARLTELPGASDYFLGSVVSYSNEVKEKSLAVSKGTLKTHGAVSEETALEMAAGAHALTGADYVFTATGIAGPSGGTKEKPVGTVWSAIRTPEKTFSGKIPIKGSIKTRSLIVEYTVTYLIASLYRYLTHQIEPYDV